LSGRFLEKIERLQNGRILFSVFFEAFEIAIVGFDTVSAYKAIILSWLQVR